MVMDQFVTTYRKDYLWPYVKTIGIRPQAEKLYEPEYRDQNNICACHCLQEPAPTADQAKVLGPNALGEQAWSRLGPMGPLLDPRLYPARVGASPESNVSRYNQPNVFLQKLQEKYPFIYECLRTAPPDDLISRINRDRLRSTYQVDFCKMEEYPSAPYDELIRAAGVGGTPPCPEPVRLPGDPCRPNQRPIAFRPAAITKDFCDVGGSGGGGRGGGGGGGSGGGSAGGGGGHRGNGDEGNKFCVGTCHGPLGIITPGATEYRDAISRLGQMIMRDRIHKAPRAPDIIHHQNYGELRYVTIRFFSNMLRTKLCLLDYKHLVSPSNIVCT